MRPGPLGDTDFEAPVAKRAAAIAIPTGNTTLKNAGFTKLVKRDEGVYENVTASGGEDATCVPARPIRSRTCTRKSATENAPGHRPARASTLLDEPDFVFCGKR